MVTLRDSLPGRIGWTAAPRPDAARSRRCPGRAPLMMSTARYGAERPAAAARCGARRPVWRQPSCRTRPRAAAATLAVRLHAVTFTVHREREAAVRGRCRQMPGYGPA